MPARKHLLIGTLLSLLSAGAMLPAGVAIMRQHSEAAGVATWNTLGVPFLLAGLMGQTAGSTAGLSDLFLGVFAVVWVAALAKTVREGAVPVRHDQT